MKYIATPLSAKLLSLAYSVHDTASCNWRLFLVTYFEVMKIYCVIMKAWQMSLNWLEQIRPAHLQYTCTSVIDWLGVIHTRELCEFCNCVFLHSSTIVAIECLGIVRLAQASYLQPICVCMCSESMAGVGYTVHIEWLPHWEAELSQFTLVLFRKISKRAAKL